jgi:branched-chain amino acid transport system permease protein
LPGINLIIYGCVLVLIVMFAPRGVGGVGRSVVAVWRAQKDQGKRHE